MRYFVELQYDGSDFHGWQIQPNAITIQETIQKVFNVIFKKSIELTGCGRTDTGVHANQYFAHFEFNDLTLLECKELQYKLNSLLPHGIAILNIFSVNNDLHARFSAVSREYKYYLHYNKSPFLNKYSTYTFPEPDLDLLNKGAEIIKSYNDFGAFCKAGADNNTNLCFIKESYWEKINNQIVFTVKADRFLRNMVRALVGTMLDLAYKRISIDDFVDIIESKDRSKAGKSVPPQGLFLNKIEYNY